MLPDELRCLGVTSEATTLTVSSLRNRTVLKEKGFPMRVSPFLKGCVCRKCKQEGITVFTSRVRNKREYFVIIEDKVCKFCIKSVCCDPLSEPSHALVEVFSLPMIFSTFVTPVAFFSPTSKCSTVDTIIVNPGCDRSGIMEILRLFIHGVSWVEFSLTEPIPLQAV